MIFIRLEYIRVSHGYFVYDRKTRPIDRQFYSFWKTRLTDRYFWRQKIFTLTTVACKSLENSYHRPLILHVLENSSQ